MRIIKSIKEMADCSRKLQKKGQRLGFVPTMGYLHEGHLSLIRKARRETDVVLVSIFVNPAQFGPREDFKKYPRNFRGDRQLAESCGVDIIFYPHAKEMYPECHRTYVNVGEIAENLCGASRPGHFRGVATIVAKLFNIVQPDIAYFGRKDAQQAAVIEQMVGDLNMPVKIKVLPTVREKDGLAMSSRNTYLNKKERQDALVLRQSLLKARSLIKSGEKNSGRIKAVMKTMINKKKTARIDYVSIVDTRNLKNVVRIKNRVLIALAIKIGPTRLIDNMVV